MARVIRVVQPNGRGGTWDVVAVDGAKTVLIQKCKGRREAMSWAAVERAKNPAAVMLGRMGGSSTSTAKADAARANGAKGGRPVTKGGR